MIYGTSATHMLDILCLYSNDIPEREEQAYSYGDKGN